MRLNNRPDTADDTDWRRGTLNACAVKAPGFGDRRKAMMDDIAILTGGKSIMEETGIIFAGAAKYVDADLTAD